MKSFVYTSIITAALASIPAHSADESVNIESFSDNIIDINVTDKEDVTQRSKRGGRYGGIRNGGFRNRGYRGGFGGHRFRGFGFRGGFGFGSYIRPFIGFRLPTYWINPTYYVPNYTTYNLSVPTNGLIWSRYYNDAVLRDQNGFVQQTVPNVQWQGGNFPLSNNGVHNMPIEGQVYGWSEDGNVGGSPGAQSGTYQGQWNGQYVDAQGQTYQGQWSGTYTDENGQIFQGQWNGTTVGAPVASNVPTQLNQGQSVNARGAPIAQQIPQQIPQQTFQGQSFNNGGYEQCLRSNGVTGAALGALLGGVAGNRIAGRNARTAGTLIGGGVGALGGLAIEKAADKCKNLRPSGNGVAQQQYPQQQFPQQQYPQGQYVESHNGEYAQCLRKRGITGGVLGALLGGVAGNRISGRNARTAGTLIGGGLGAISGATLEKATSKCDKKRVNYGYSQQYGQQVQYYWVSPGYYYPQAATTVTVVPGTTTVTEQVIETSSKRLVKPSKRLRKPQH